MIFYHVLNRGAAKQDIVHNDGDRMRFVQSLYVFNDKRNVPNGISQQDRWKDITRQRDLLVHIHCWCLMKNHYHLLLSPIDDDPANISLFMKKLNAGFAKFMNEKYEDHVGSLWQGKYKKVPISRDAHFMYLPYYIHLNPLDYTYSGWRDGNITDFAAVHNTLKEYRWSSYLDYQGQKNFPSLIHTSVLESILEEPHEQSKTIENFISRNNLQAYRDEFSSTLE